MPNITGQLGFGTGGPKYYWFTGGEGALYNTGVNRDVKDLQESNGTISRSSSGNINLGASRSSSIFGKSKTVQTTSIRLLALTRT